MDFQALFYAFFGGLLPAAIWLWFWLKEDSVHPEPRGLIVITFIAGMIGVGFVIPFQQMIFSKLGPMYGETSIAVLFLLALVEEIAKFGAAYFVALRSKAFDEPIDAVIYMVTAALGFTAFENALFLLDPLSGGRIIDTIITGNMRFVGASILHVMCSAIVGLGIAFFFYRRRSIRRDVVFLAILVATALHTLFNLSIISSSGSNMFVTFLVLWFSVVGLLLFFEKIKRLNHINAL
jgi:RsiW-degrading membrane proteinase PrsW (M82 family)